MKIKGNIEIRGEALGGVVRQDGVALLLDLPATVRRGSSAVLASTREGETMSLFTPDSGTLRFHERNTRAAPAASYEIGPGGVAVRR